MAYKTFGDLKSQVSMETDIEDEEFVQSTELVGYFDSGIRVIESEIIKLGLREQYLKDEAFISLIQGQADYDLPADIIDTKIRKIVYQNGPIIYTMDPAKGEDSYVGEVLLNQYNSSSEEYEYDVIKLTDEYKLRIIPTPQIAVTNGLKLLYWKDLNRYVDDDTTVDTPEICYEFLMSYVRYRIYKKENNILTAEEKEALADSMTRMRETLSGQIADPTIDLIDQDLSFYEEMS